MLATSVTNAVSVPASALPEAPPARPTPQPPGFFQKQWPAALILAAFPLLALPMAAGVLLSPDNLLLWVYIWLFGMTHFVVTLALYLRSGNLRHFASTPGNRLIFFAVPLALLVGFDLYHAFRIGAAWPVAGVLVLLAVRLADFNHFNRQSFGVLQLFKSRAGVKPAPADKRAENQYFLALVGLLFLTFISGGTCPLLQPGGPLTVAAPAESIFPPLLPLPALQVAWAGLTLVTLVLFTRVMAGLRRTTSGRRGGGTATAYVLVQTASALMAALYFPLYLAALAVHYVEYHVLMAPRCLRAPLDPASRLDRAYDKVRARPVVFYSLVVAVAGLVALCARAGMGMMGSDPGSVGKPFEYLMLVAVFDGLFMFHYFVEMFVWRFSEPHFRQELAGLYFAPPK